MYNAFYKYFVSLDKFLENDCNQRRPFASISDDNNAFSWHHQFPGKRNEWRSRKLKVNFIFTLRHKCVSVWLTDFVIYIYILSYDGVYCQSIALKPLVWKQIANNLCSRRSGVHWLKRKLIQMFIRACTRKELIQAANKLSN